MKKIALFIFLASTNLMASDNVTREEYDAKPMIEGNQRVMNSLSGTKIIPEKCPL